MDKQRLELLHRHKDAMGVSLTAELDRFEQFCWRTKPRVAVLCADNHLRMEMEQILTPRTDMDVVLYGTYGEEWDLFEMMLSDAVIAVSAAKTIAPKGLFQAMESLSKLDKEVYFILGRWSSMAKTQEMSRSRKKRVPQEFPFSKIVCIMNASNVDVPEFHSAEEIVDRYAAQICSSFDKNHEIQSEKLYAYLQARIEEFYNIQQERIYSEETILRNAQHFVSAKQERFDVIFPHSSVALHNVIDRIAREFLDISLGELENEIPDLEMDYQDSKFASEKAVKQAMIKQVERIFERYRNPADNDVRIKTQATVDDVVAEMHQITTRVRAKVHIDDAYKEELESVVNDRQRLVKIVDKHSQLYDVLIDKAQRKITAVVNSYEFQYDRSLDKKLLEMKQKVESALDILLEEDPDIRNQVGELNTENAEQVQYEQFRTAIKQMISAVSDQAAGILYSCADAARSEITQTAAQMLKGYFIDILSILKKMESHLIEARKTYVME